MVALADLVEADRAPALVVGAHDRAHTCDRRAPLGGGQPELDLLADLQRARSREQDPAAAEVHRVGLDRALLPPVTTSTGRVDWTRTYSRSWISSIECSSRKRSSSRLLERHCTPQPDPPAAVGELEHQLVERPVIERPFGAEHQRHQQPLAVALGDPRLDALAARAHEGHGVGALR